MPEPMPDTFVLVFQRKREFGQAAIAQIHLCPSGPGICHDSEHGILLSRPCFSVEELRREIDRLQKELEYLWHAGRRGFSDLEPKTSQLAQASDHLVEQQVVGPRGNPVDRRFSSPSK